MTAAAPGPGPGPTSGTTSTRAGADPDDGAPPLATGTLEDVPVEADAEKPSRVLDGRLGLGISVVAALLSVYAVWNVFSPVPALQYRIVFLAVVLPLTFLLYRPALPVLRGEGRGDRPGLLDWGLADVEARPGKGDVPFTYWDYRAGMMHKNLGMRIDYVLATPAVPVRDAWVDREARKGKGASDHAPLVADVDLV